MLLIIACFALGTVVSMRAQAGLSHGSDPLARGVICLHDDGSLEISNAGLSNAGLINAGLVGDPAAPLDESDHCHTDCALCGGGTPSLLAGSALKPGAPAFAALPPAYPLPVLPRIAGSFVHVPPKQGPPRIA